MWGDEVKLVVPTMEYENQIQAYRQEILDKGDHMTGCQSLREVKSIQEWIDKVKDYEDEATCPKNLVPSTHLLYLRFWDKKVVGIIQIRHYLNEFLGQYGGHIGYAICPSERKKGYGSKMLEATLKICKIFGMERILLICREDNEASRKVILKNGGVYESNIYQEDKAVYLERYWIEIK